jgi:hypothetical protein
MRSNSRRKRELERLKSEDGTFTIEAALLLPISCLLAVCAVFASVLAAQSSLAYVTAAESADRTAHVWDNSFKHPVTGMFSLLEFDPLYWRWLNDGADPWFGFATGRGVSTVSYPPAKPITGGLAERKLSLAADTWPEAYTGQGSFESTGYSKSVTLTSAVLFRAPRLFTFTWPDSAAGTSTEAIVEPAEYIRNIELVLGYIPIIQKRLEGDAVRNTLSRWIDRPELVPNVDRSLTFRHHSEAVKYLRALVRGTEGRIPTVETGKWRLLDALDKHGISHQAYIGAKTLNKDVTGQMWKDAELIRQGKVNGVVWHFFRRTGESSAGPSESLKRELKKHGIIVVVHA